LVVAAEDAKRHVAADLAQDVRGRVRDVARNQDVVVTEEVGGIVEHAARGKGVSVAEDIEHAVAEALCLDVAGVAEIHRKVEEGGRPVRGDDAGRDGGQFVGVGAAADTEADGDVANITGCSARLYDIAIALCHSEVEIAVRSNEYVCAASIGEAQGSRRSDISLRGNRTGCGIAPAVRNGEGEESSGVGEGRVADRNSAGEEPSGVRCAVA